jgi:hypothetical protein
MSDGDSDFVAEVEVDAISQSCQYVGRRYWHRRYWHRRPKSDQARFIDAVCYRDHQQAPMRKHYGSTREKDAAQS